MKLPQELERFIISFSKLPTIGAKTSLKLGLWIIQNKTVISDLAESLQGLSNLSTCEKCRSLSVKEKCVFCDSPERDRTLICVVEKYGDILSFERSGFYNGLYFCLGSLWAPSNGITFDKLPLNSLCNMIKMMDPKEIILALPFSLQGDATAKLISDAISAKFQGIRLTRLARGLPKGSEIDQVDDYSLSYAFRYRKDEM